MEQADEGGEVDGTDSESVSPGANEHEQSVKADQAINSAEKNSDQGQLRAPSLAVKVTVINQVDVVSHKVAVHFRIIPIERVRHCKDLFGVIPCVDWVDGMRCLTGRKFWIDQHVGYVLSNGIDLTFGQGIQSLLTPSA